MVLPRIQCVNATSRALSKGIRAFSTSAPTANLSALSNLIKPPPNPSSRTQPSSPSSFLSSLDERPAYARTQPKPPGPSTPLRAGNVGPNHLANIMNLGPSRRGTDSIAEAEDIGKAAAMTKQITRRWKAGDVYAPHDLSAPEMAKWKRRGKPTKDVFDVLDFNPRDHYSNFAIMSEYMTPLGRIMHRIETGLRPVNQRKIARAIRRSIGIGMMPSVHRHPEILRASHKKYEQNSPWAKGPI